MQFLTFMIYSSIEWMSMIIIMFALFRFRLRGRLPEAIYISLLMSFFSYVLRGEGWAEYAPFLQIFLYVVVVCLLFRVQWLHGTVMAIVGYQMYTIWQTFIGLLVIYGGIFEASELTYFHPGGRMLVGVSIAVPLAVSILLRYKGWGFTFVQPKSKRKVEWTPHNTIFFAVSVLGCIIFGAVWFFFNYRQMEFFLLFSAIHLLVLIGMIYLSVKKDKEKESVAKSGETVSG
jgi:hypothetical protein